MLNNTKETINSRLLLVDDPMKALKLTGGHRRITRCKSRVGIYRGPINSHPITVLFKKPARVELRKERPNLRGKLRSEIPSPINNFRNNSPVLMNFDAKISVIVNLTLRAKIIYKGPKSLCSIYFHNPLKIYLQFSSEFICCLVVNTLYLQTLLVTS